MTKRKIDDLYPEMECFMNEDMSDVIFLVEGKRIPAFKALLLVKSRVFRAMFSDKFIEGKDKEVVIEDTTFKPFQTLIRFIYTEQLVLKDKDNDDIQLLADICGLADRFDVQRLIAKVSDHLKSRINVENIDLVSRIAFDHNIEELKSKIIEFLENYILYGDFDYRVTTLYRHLSERHEIIELKNKIAKYLNTNLCVENVEPVSRIVFDYNFDEFKMKIIEILETNINELVKRDRDELIALYFSTDYNLLDVLLSPQLKPAEGLYELRVGGKTFLIIWKLLTQQMKNTFRKLLKDPTINTMSPKVLKTFIGCAYFGSIKRKLSLDHIEEVCDLCVKYDAIEIINDICFYLEYRSLVLELKPISRIAFKFKIEILMTKVREFIDENFELIIKENIEDLKEINRFTDDSLFEELIKRQI